MFFLENLEMFLLMHLSDLYRKKNVTDIYLIVVYFLNYSHDNSLSYHLQYSDTFFLHRIFKSLEPEESK